MMSGSAAAMPMVKRLAEQHDAEQHGHQGVDVGDDGGACRADLDDEGEEQDDASAVQTTASVATAPTVSSETECGRWVRAGAA